MKLEILSYPDPILAKTAKEVPEITPEIKELAANMLETMYEDKGIGLAAPQIGESIRMIVVDISGPDAREEQMVLINPVITVKCGCVDSEEGCLSVPGQRFTIERSDTVTVEALNLDGEKLVIEADGLLSVCLQHEIDHLDGKLILDHVSRLKRSMYDRRIKKMAKKRK